MTLNQLRGLRASVTSPQPKSDISDLGQLIVPNSGKPEFGRGEVGSRLRDPGEGDRPSQCTRAPLTRNARAARAHSDPGSSPGQALSPAGRGEEPRRQST